MFAFFSSIICDLTWKIYGFLLGGNTWCKWIKSLAEQAPSAHKLHLIGSSGSLSCFSCSAARSQCPQERAAQQWNGSPKEEKVADMGALLLLSFKLLMLVIVKQSSYRFKWVKCLPPSQMLLVIWKGEWPYHSDQMKKKNITWELIKHIYQMMTFVQKRDSKNMRGSVLHHQSMWFLYLKCERKQKAESMLWGFFSQCLLSVKSICCFCLFVVAYSVTVQLICVGKPTVMSKL